MPYLKLNTTLEIDSHEKPVLLQQLSTLMSEQTGKPESYVMIEIADARTMLFAASALPLAYLECKSIGLSTTQTQPLAAAICQLLHTRLQIAPERVYIEFSDCSAAYWGWNGTTFA